MMQPSQTLLLLLTLQLSSCVFLPVTQSTFSNECNITTRHMTLQPVQIAALTHCHRRECAAFLAAAGATAAASAIVSGSIAIIGNVVYWLEETGRCQPSPRTLH